MFELGIKNVEYDAYKVFIDAVSNFSDKFLLVERKDMDSSENLKYVLKKLEISLIEMKEQSEWPSTMLGDGATANVYYYNVDDNSIKVLKEEAESLFSWEHPKLPEDLCFIKDDNAWISTCSHEGYCDIFTNDSTVIKDILSIEGVEEKTYY